MSECLFCKIIKGEIPSTKVFENETVFGFKDINPMAKDHYLFIHKKHTSNFIEQVESDSNQILEIYQAITKFSKEINLNKNGLRVVTNLGEDGGQTVFHTHFHVLGGEKLRGFGA